MSVVSIKAWTCPDCRHAEHEGRVCNAVGGLGACRCSPYEWVDISEWQATKKEERVTDYEVIRQVIQPIPPQVIRPIPPLRPLTRAERLHEYLFLLYGYVPWKLAVAVLAVLLLITLFISTCISDIGFSHGD